MDVPGPSPRIWDREAKREKSEPVFAESVLHFLYGERLVGRVLRPLVAGRAFGRLYGAYQSSRLSRRKIAPFVTQFGIDASEYEARDYRSFNDYFARRFRPGARTFAAEPTRLPAFAEGRLLAYDAVIAEARLPIKGASVSPTKLLGGAERARSILGGPCVIIRLCPQDYHRFHYPDDGKVASEWRLPGPLDSVGPIALGKIGSVLHENERHVTVLETQSFGALAYVEIGAMTIGKIVQVHGPGHTFRRGEEKGYFAFGGSTVILLGEPGRWSPAPDLVEKTATGWETFVRLGEPIATAHR